ncbi:hypothetical protein [Bradyrhizobium sp. 191]|uniref:hypothetical protein n=1 Tax=Bradyrhizobium sp. 191 TaxID=2782659 RepID=UPI0020005830|nr:hypothetical protein [Bradyrhizobium sp. 191]UPJ66745.1 hypothetical protein IVB23_05045 [Bradyrhizobium sp. 191]
MVDPAAGCRPAVPGVVRAGSIGLHEPDIGALGSPRIFSLAQPSGMLEKSGEDFGASRAVTPEYRCAF